MPVASMLLCCPWPRCEPLFQCARVPCSAITVIANLHHVNNLTSLPVCVHMHPHLPVSLATRTTHSPTTSLHPPPPTPTLRVTPQVGNYPGRALSFSIPPGSASPELQSLPSKRVGLYAPHGGTLIARSDTNGEDLEAFAGAGLYDRCVAWRVLGQGGLSGVRVCLAQG